MKNITEVQTKLTSVIDPALMSGHLMREGHTSIQEHLLHWPFLFIVFFQFFQRSR